MQHNRARHIVTSDLANPVRRGPRNAAPDTPRLLETRVAALFRRLGYRVGHRPITHDQGFDLAVSRPGVRAVVQCKRWRHPVGPP